MSELVLYTSDDGRTRLGLRVEGQTVRLTQLEIAEQNVSLHAKNILVAGEMVEDSVVKDSLTTAANDQPLLDGAGSVSHEAMKTIATERYDSFDAKRRKQEAIEADAEDLKAIEDLEKDLKRKGGKK